MIKYQNNNTLYIYLIYKLFYNELLFSIINV